MKLSQIAAQLYTCRDLLKTPADIAKTLHRVRAAGYTAVQISGLGPIETAELNKILDGEGLVCCATHEDSNLIRQSPEQVVERLAALRCTITAYPYPRDVDLGSLESVQGLIRDLDRAGKVLADAGQVLCYHNHHHEFRKLGGKTIFERIFDETDPKHLQGEPDTYWVQYGGANPVDWCRRLQGRLPAIHLKDYKINEKTEPELCEIGAGNIDFRAVIAAAEEAGCRWFIVEQDTCPGDPVDSLAQSFRWLQENVAR
jgi:sugar phosphate isomerase/epimerase